MKFFGALVKTNIYLSIAAVFLTIESQIQLGQKPGLHTYLFLVFFATLFDYNLHKLVSPSEKDQWVRDNLKLFYLLLLVSGAGFICSAFMAKKEVLWTLAPLALVTLFYSIPFFFNGKNLFRLRDIPFLKVFLIAIVWSAATVLLPVIQSDSSFGRKTVLMILAERFFFLFAITLPFDIRDMEADRIAGLKTIPILINENRSLLVSYISLLISFVIAFLHYQMQNLWYIIWALVISIISSFLFLKVKKIRSLPYYHHGILDGTVLLQGLLVVVFYYFGIGANP